MQNELKIKDQSGNSSKTLLPLVVGGLTITCEDNTELLSRTKKESVDIICIDPPYKYLKNQKLETDFNEFDFFTEAKRVLTKDGFIIMFGRGISFYRMNCILAELGFNFKEEIIWNKKESTSPFMSLSRIHESISIFSKSDSKINKVKINYVESKQHNIDSVIRDIKELKAVFKNKDLLKDINHFLDHGEYNYMYSSRTDITYSNSVKKPRTPVTIVNSIQTGMNEKSIIEVTKGRHNRIHPTEKPVRLIERLLNICLPAKKKEEILVADFFGGSFSTMEAVFNLGLKGISCEIDEEYFNKGIERIINHASQQKLF